MSMIRDLFIWSHFALFSSLSKALNSGFRRDSILSDIHTIHIEANPRSVADNIKTSRRQTISRRPKEKLETNQFRKVETITTRILIGSGWANQLTGRQYLSYEALVHFADIISGVNDSGPAITRRLRERPKWRTFRPDLHLVSDLARWLRVAF